MSRAGCWALAGGAGLWASGAPGAAWATGKSPRLAAGNDRVLRQLVSVKNGPPGRPFVAMTFDDGPHPSLTPRLLDLLKARRIRASFFVIGRNASRYPDLIRRMVDEGHEIGNHGWNHADLIGHDETALLDQLDRTTEAIFRAVKKAPVTMRPPYGSLAPWQARLIHKKRAMVTTMWNVDPLDWQRPGAGVVASRIVRGAQSGAIILAHDIHGPTIRAMPTVFDGIAAKGLHFTTISMLLGARDWSRKRFRRAVPLS